VARYVAPDPASLRIVPLDSLTAIYHRASGITHLVDAPVPEILAALTEPTTAAELLARLTADYDLGDPDSQALADRLNELKAVGLVSPA
jgi:PqqD family protein of HPr-rel-A system